MSEGKRAIILIDVINEFYEKLNDRIKKATAVNRKKIFVKDYVYYTVIQFIYFGWTPETDSCSTITDTLDHILYLCFMQNRINCEVNWSDDMEYITMT